MASIDRHQYSQDIRKGAEKLIDNLGIGKYSRIYRNVTFETVVDVLRLLLMS